MSAGLMNLGMGWEPQRQDSSVVGGVDYAAQAAAQQAAYQQQIAGLQRPQDPNEFLRTLTDKQAEWEYNNLGPTPGSGQVGSLADAQQAKFNQLQPLAERGALSQYAGLFAPEYAAQYAAYGGNQNSVMGAGYGQSGAFAGQQAQYGQQVSAISQQAQAAAQAAAKAEAERAQNQTVQQQAYGQQTGGGFSGGILNSSYAKPFGNTITGMADMGGAFSGGMMGGNATAAPSTGLMPAGPASSPAAGFGAPGHPGVS